LADLEKRRAPMRTAQPNQAKTIRATVAILRNLTRRPK
jgi:hypothetical protein